MQEDRLSVGSVTRAAKKWAASPVGRLARIEILVTLSCALLAVLVLLGSGRQASRSAAFRAAVWTALMLSYPAVSYTIGLMQSASFRNEFIVVWGCFLLLLLGSADGIAAYSLSDSDQQARTVINQGLQLVYVFLLLLSYVGSLPLQLKCLLFLAWALSGAKLGMRVWFLILASRDRVLHVDNKLIADYMSREHEVGGPDYDAVTMRGYKYVVAGETEQEGRRANRLELTNDLVTVDLVWQCEGKLLRSTADGGALKLKDLCLSFALFKLLRRRLGRYLLHESCLNKTRDFMKLGLLADDHHERMYRVIEVELGFLFDFYYARYRSPKQSLMPDTALFAAVAVTSLYTLFASTVIDYRALQNHPDIVHTRFDIGLTTMMIILFLVLESFQYFALVFSDWHKVKMLSRYVRDPWWHNRPLLERLVMFMCNVRPTRYWNNSLGQYSLLDACLRYDKQLCGIGRVPLPKSIICFLIRSRMTGQRKLPDAAKCAIYRFLKTSLTRIRNGEYTLEKNGVLDDFYWSVAQGSTAQRMLVWHIATAICDAEPRGDAFADSDIKESHLVATTLSAYCAYLMSSAPELLPDHSYDTQLLFEGVQLKAREIVKGCRSKNDMYDKIKLRDFQSEEDDDFEDILAEGKRLGHEIIHKLRDTERWKVLAELWVEMLLSAAPSDNATGHVRKLATGGELITHLWALLTHAGIVERPMSRYQQKGRPV